MSNNRVNLFTSGSPDFGIGFELSENAQYPGRGMTLRTDYFAYANQGIDRYLTESTVCHISSKNNINITIILPQTGL